LVAHRVNTGRRMLTGALTMRVTVSMPIPE